VLNTGDVIELHSGVFGTAAVTWQDYDPADVWYELLTTYAGVPPERVGHGSLPRGGRPPHVTDRAPGDVATQAKCKVTFAAREDEPVDEMIDQISFICGGATVEIDGQICYVQVYPLYDASGVISVPLPAIAKTFDPRDYSNPSTSPSLESRTTVVTGIYGVNKAATNSDAYPERLTVGVDVDAVAWLTQQSIEDIGNSELPEKIGRWLYNSADVGLYLTTQVIAQVVRAGSTGLRVFGFSTVDQYPELIPGDVIALITDQYTDYDPATARELRGWLAVKGVIVKVANGGRSFGMYVLGLADNVTTLKGFAPGSLAGVGQPPGNPLILADFNSAGKATVTVFGGEGTVSAKIAVDTAATPLDATVEATAPINGSIFSVLFNTPLVPPGGTLYIKLFEYTDLDGGGVRSTPYTVAFQRPTGDVAQPPTADLLVQAESQTAMTIRLTGTVGQGGAGPLQYRYRLDTNGVAGAWSAYAAFPSGGGTYVDIVQSKNAFYARKLVGQVRDSSPTPVESAVVSETISGRLESHSPTTGRIDPIVPTNSGFNVFQYGSDNADGVLYSPATGKAFIHFDQTDQTIGGGRVVAIKRSGVNAEPTSNIFKRGSDSASDVVTTTSRTFVDPSTATQVDGSGRIVGVYRLGVVEPVNNLVKTGDAASFGATSFSSLVTVTPNNGIKFLGVDAGIFQSAGLIFIGDYTAAVRGLRVNHATGFISVVDSSQSPVQLNEITNAVDYKKWWLQTLSTGTFRIRAVNDAETNGNNAISFARSGITIVGVFFGGYLAPNGFLGTAIEGDVVSRRSATTGVYYFGDANTKYLYYNGAKFFLAGAALEVQDGSVNAAAQLRATGWWTAGDSVGLGFEAGVSAGQIYIYAYNRTSGLYGIMNFGATAYNFQGPASIVLGNGSVTAHDFVLN
jgi:hypothetical protein